MAFSPEQLNFFKFSSVVLDEFPVTLRTVFVFMWDNFVATTTTTPSVPKWDDSITVHNILLTNEGGPKKASTLNKSYKEWDCTAFFKATLFAQTFAIPDGTGGVSTLDRLYVRPLGLSAGTFHSSVRSATGNHAETCALALDQLRKLRNTLCHQNSTREIDKVTFAHYLSLAKDAFTALGQNTSRIDEIGKLAEDDFPTTRLKQLEEDLKREKDAAITFKQIDDHLIKIASKLEDVVLDVKDVKTRASGVKDQLDDIGSDLKELKADFAHKQQAMHLEGSKGPLFPYSCMPDKIPHFVGRQKECQVIMNHLTNQGTRLVDIWGPPGFGKTAVAINVAHLLLVMGIATFFISLRGMKSKDELVSKLLSIFADARQAVHVSPSHWLMQCLQQLRNPFVLVLDNADDLLESGDPKLKEDVLRFAEEILTQCSHIKLVFTTRECLDYLSHKIPVHNERVGVLDVASSKTLVRSLSPNFSDDNCSTIVRVCGQVPLAVRLMCSIMRQEHVSLNELLEELKISPIIEVLNTESFPNDASLKAIINKSFERVIGHERDAFVSLRVFPRSFGIEEARAVADLKTLRKTKQVIRSLERKSLVTCNEDFSACTIHSLLRSFIDERRTTDQETGATFLAAQHRFYSYHISNFEMANEKFLTGQSNEALVAFLDQRDSMILSLINGPNDKELYPKVVEVLPKAELFLFALLPDEESLFRTIYDTAVKEAQKRQDVNDEGKLLAAKSFSHWGWFSSDHQTWDDFFPAGPTDSADFYPAKLLCYFGICQLLLGKLDDGISSLQNAVNSLSSSCDETILKQLVYDALAISCKKKQEHKMASYFMDLNRTMAKSSSAYVGISALENILGSVKDNAFCLTVTSSLIRLLLSERKALNPEVLRATAATCKFIYSGKLESLSLEHILSFWEDITPIRRLDVNELKEQFSISTNMAIAFESFSNFATTFDIDPSRVSLFALTQMIETALPYLESIREEFQEICGLLWADLRNAMQPLKEDLWSGAKSSEDDDDVDFEALARTYDVIGKLCYLTNDYGGAIKSHQCAVKIREENIGDHVDTSTSLTSIGSVHFEMGNGIAGIKSFQSALELREQLGIPNNVDTSNIYHTLGDKHFTLGNYKEAIEAHLEALKLRKKYLGEHCLTGKSLQRIAEVYYQKGVQSVTSYCNSLEKVLSVESYKEALTFCQQALAMRLELLGEHIDTAESFHTLGCIHYETGDMSSAVEAFQVASDMRSNLLGDDRDTVKSYNHLGLTKCGMGDHKGALESLQKALLLERKLSIGDQPGIADITSNIGRVYHEMGDYQSAREQFQNAVDFYEKLLDKHERTATSYYALAFTHLAMGSYPEALECLRQASTMGLEVLGQHVHTADSFHMLGVVYHKINDFTSAVEAFQTASDMRSTLLGEHQYTAVSYHWLGFAKFGMGDHKGALESLQKSLQLGRKLSTGHQPGIADTTCNIGEVHHKKGDCHTAREQFQNAVDFYKNLLDNYKSIATSYHNLAEAHLAMERYPEALECFRLASTMRLEALGQHIHTAESFHMLGVLYHKINDFTSAVEAFQTSSDMRSALLGDHPDTAESYH